MRYYGTLGPACADREILIHMIEKGMTGVRLNVSHTGLKKSRSWIQSLNEAERATGKKMELLIDLQGPELRIGNLAKPLYLKEGDFAEFIDKDADASIENKESDEGMNVRIPIPHEVLQSIKAGQRVLLDDGKMLLGMESERRAEIIRGGILTGRKSILIEGVSVELKTLTQEDEENIALIKQYGVTGVMLPFVRGREDLENLRLELIKAGAGDTKIFAKIENQRGVMALDEILNVTDEIVIARGDLGNSCPLWELPKLQEQIAKACRERGVNFMVVTQMLSSMEINPVPTRAEMSDIYLAVKQGAASVMLTGETASGKYPVEAMEYFVRAGESACTIC